MAGSKDEFIEWQNQQDENMKTKEPKKYRAGAQGGRGMINIGKEHIGKSFYRTTEADGSISFIEVTK